MWRIPVLATPVRMSFSNALVLDRGGSGSLDNATIDNRVLGLNSSGLRLACTRIVGTLTRSTHDSKHICLVDVL